MQRFKTIRHVFLTLTALANLPQPALGLQDRTASEQSFLAALEDATERADAGEWARTSKILAEALATGEGADYIWRRRPELVELMTRGAFWKGRTAPQPRDVVSGRVDYYSASGGNIKIVYGPDELDDFVVYRKGEEHQPEGRIRIDDVFAHPIVFAGPYSVTVKSSRYPSVHEDGCPWILAGYDGREWLQFVFGTPKPTGKYRYQRWYPGRLRYTKDGKTNELCLKEKVPCRPGSKFTLKVKVDQRSTTGSYNGKTFLRGKKPDGLYGSVAIGGFLELDEIVLEGKAERSWMQGLIDARLQDEWAEFEKEGGTDAGLPEWLRLEPLPWEIRHSAEHLPSGSLDSEPGVFDELLEKLTESPSAAFRFAKDLSEDETSEAFREYAQAVAFEARGLTARALRRVESVLEADPGFLPARKMRASLLRVRGEQEQARKALERVITDHPRDGWAYAQCARNALRDGERSEAGVMVDRAIEADAYDARVDYANRLITKALRGPAFHDPAEYRSDNYVIRSDIDRRTCIDASKILENALPWYEKAFGDVPEGKVFEVYLFAGPYGYHRYIADAFQTFAPSTAGLYWLELDQLLIWSTPKREHMLATIRHEGFHQYMDQLVRGGPLWFHEGLAEYWQEADFTRMKSRQVPVREEYVEYLLGKADMKPLATFLHQSHAEFRRDNRLHYAQAWAVVHYLLHGPKENQALFRTLLDSLKNGVPTEEALAAAFGDVDMDELERGFEKYLRSLR